MNETEIIKQQIRELNQTFRDAEFNRNIPWMQNVLDDELTFRRASGIFETKQSYLAWLADPTNTYDHLENISMDISIHDGGKLATAMVMVKASGKKGKERIPYSGINKNIRFFRKKDGWKLYHWYNEIVSNEMIVHLPHADDSTIKYVESKDGYMCGLVKIEALQGFPVNPATRCFNVKFENGARTKRHRHMGVQVLIVKEGKGLVQQDGNSPFEIGPGDRVYIPENVWHWHGAQQGHTMVHLAITNGETEWDMNDKCK